jgi:prepilin-type N-terminal cleavage/methylation domain-containing protein
MSNRRGFTIIELLVSLGIVAVVVSLIVTGLARTRKTAGMTKDLALIRQNGAATLMYTGDFKDTFPILGRSAYDVMHWWYECLLATGHVASRQAVDPHYKEPPVHDRSRFQFTMTTSIAQQYFTPEGALRLPDTHLEAHRVAQVTFPSHKGMIVRGWNGDFPYYTPSSRLSQLNIEWFYGNSRTPIAAFDGSARVDARASMIGGNPEFVISGIGLPLFSTWGGLNGVDWQ